MKLLIDNNIVIDVFQDREPFSEKSAEILEMIEFGYHEGYITANSITDIYYILKRSIRDRGKVYDYLKILLKIVKIVDIRADDIYRALEIESKDFEDELIIVCGKKENIDYIITRNIKDFNESSIKAVEPEEFIRML